MRAGTLSDPRVEEFLAANFSRATRNQLPKLYCNDRIDATQPNPYPPAQLASLAESAGGGNIRFYFCDRNGLVVHYVAGYWKPEALLAECAFALSLLDDPERAAVRRAERRVLLIRAREGEHDPKRRVAFARLVRNLDETPAGQHVDKVLRQVEDDIYLKGAVG